MSEEAGTGIQPSVKKPPFESLSFSMDDLFTGRSSFVMGRNDAGEYSIKVKTEPPADSGLAAADFTRETSADAAREMRNDLARVGVFRWDEHYGGQDALGETEWKLEIVFQKDVFTFESGGCGEYPKDFEDMMDVLYRVGLPRPGMRQQAKPQGSASAGFSGMPNMGGMPGASAMPNMGDFSQFSQMFGQVDGRSVEEARRAIEHMQENPGAYVQLMKEQFRAMPAAVQSQMLDMLAASGMYTREWWDNFLRS